ncbi:hypothetical protein JYG23_11535 [Sedimentibacter sp. zth1]|uniref:stalk domain-containing protein n=1 Tax=Sedimentibacter sp. zth1 TaxID=2816908 RepID=UPI001A913ECF|nr:stalk domain-containing protein [Sedimentibacter sp. zth1]QSX05302.1 hypothetical protein JYG23_11535 [Sedimentibacter sp. zth1]
MIKKTSIKMLRTLLLTVLISSMFIITVFAVDISIDGLKVNFTKHSGYPFVDANNRTMVPLRLTMESIGAKVDWDSANKTAIVTKGETEVKVKIGESYIYKNREKLKNDTAAIIKNKKTYLPIRAVLECFGATINWDGKTKTVLVNTQEDVNFVTLIENMPIIDNYWPIIEEATSLKTNKNYSNAILKFESIISAIKKEGNFTNVALMYNRMGDCYSKLANYDKAKQCWLAEAIYWDKAGKVQETTAANRKADLLGSEVKLYAVSTNEERSQIDYFDAPLEPKKGILLGAYAEGDSNVHDSSSNKKFYMNDFPDLVGKDHAAYLLYFSYGMDLSTYSTHIRKAVQLDKIIELALQPLDGLDMVNDTDGYLVKLAKDMEKSGAKFMLRFANEMNDPTNPWYTTDYNKYIEKFRIVSGIFKEHAPSVAIVWAPNFYPPDNITYYYPGDEYVDYVGISSYKNNNPQLDPLNQGIDRSRWSNQLDLIYSLYGDKKPIIVSEGGCSFKQASSGKDLTNYAARQLDDFYAYIPLRYPNLKAVFYFNQKKDVTNYCLSQNKTVLDAYKDAINDEYYLSSATDSDSINEYYYQLAGNTVSSEEIALCSYVKCATDNVKKVEYMINGVTIGTTESVPYRVNCDFSKYKGQHINITVNAFDSNGKLLVSKTFSVNVE